MAHTDTVRRHTQLTHSDDRDLDVDGHRRQGTPGSAREPAPDEPLLSLTPLALPPRPARPTCKDHTRLVADLLVVRERFTVVEVSTQVRLLVHVHDVTVAGEQASAKAGQSVNPSSSRRPRLQDFERGQPRRPDTSTGTRLPFQHSFGRSPRPHVCRLKTASHHGSPCAAGRHRLDVLPFSFPGRQPISRPPTAGGVRLMASACGAVAPIFHCSAAQAHTQPSPSRA